MANLTKKDLILDVNFLSGTAYDWTGNNGTGTIVNGDGFSKTCDGWGFNDTFGEITDFNRNTYVQFPHDDIQNLDACAITVRIDGVNSTKMGGMLGKFSSYQFALGYPGYFINNIVLQGAGTTYSFLAISNVPDGTKTLGVRKAAGVSVPEFYADGVFIGNGNAAIEFGTTTNPLILANYGSTSAVVSVDQPIQSIVIRSSEGTPEDMANDHKALISRKGNFLNKQNFYTGASIPALDTGSGWNMTLKNDNNIIDQGGQVMVMTNLGEGNQSSETIWGEPSIKMDGSVLSGFATGVVNFYDYLDNPWGAFLWVKNESSIRKMILQLGLINTDGFTLEKDLSDNIVFTIHNPGGNTSVTSSDVIQDGIWHLVGIFSEGSTGNMYVYVDGRESNSAASQAMLPNTNAFRIGDFQAGGLEWEGEIGPFPRIDQFSSKSAFEDALKTEWNRVANKVIYYEDFEDAHINQAPITTAGDQVTSSDWKVLSVSGQIVDGPDLGTKSITSPSAGNSLVTRGIDHTFGRIEIDMTPTAGTRCRHAFSEPGAFAILDVVDSGNNRIAYTTSTGGIVFATANGTATLDRQTIKIDKRADLSTNNTSIFRDNVLLTPAVGTNPCTDITNFTLERQITTYSNAQIHSIKHYFGVPLT